MNEGYAWCALKQENWLDVKISCQTGEVSDAV
jgi:hypothetical protein